MTLFKRNIKKLTDEELMKLLVKNNSQEPLSELYERYSKKLLGYFIRMFKGDQEKAQDFLQDLFIKIFDKKALFDPNKKFYTWIFTIASNMCKTEFRNQKKYQLSEYDSSGISYSVNPDNTIDKTLFRQLLKEGINKLEYHHKVVFILRFNARFNLQEIAEITDSSVGTVKSRLFYATKKIKEDLKTYNPKNESNFFQIN